MAVSELFADRVTEQDRAEYRLHQERNARATPQDLVTAFDSLYQSQDYILALGKAVNFPRGVYVRDDFEQRRWIGVEKNGAHWSFGRGEVTKTVIKQVPDSELYGEMTFDVPIVDVRISETIKVSPKEAEWTRSVSHLHVGEELREQKEWNSEGADEKIRAVIDSYNSDKPVQLESQPAPEGKVIFITEDKGEWTPEFTTIKQRIENAMEILRKRRGIFSVSVQRNDKGDFRLFINTSELDVKDDEKAKMIEGVEGVDVVFNPLRDVYVDPSIPGHYREEREELAKWSHVGRFNLNH